MNDRAVREFSRSFALHLGSVMRERGVQQIQVATALDRTKSYVSVRVNGKKPVDSDMLDAVAELAGVDTKDLLDEINRRMSASIAPRDPDMASYEEGRRSGRLPRPQSRGSSARNA